MTKQMKTYLALLLTMLFFVSCSNTSNDASNPVIGSSDAANFVSDSENSGAAYTPDNHELIVPVIEGCRISSKRTGVKRQGLYQVANGFECTDTGSYWIIGNWILYSDHASDAVIKLCGRPDCTHSDKDCNAYVEGGDNICYYEGYLYTCGDAGLIRMNLDGSDHLLVFDLPAFMAEQQCKGIANPVIWNGIFSFDLPKLDESGNQIYTSYYYKLDGSMEAPIKTAVHSIFLYTDGDIFFGVVGYDAETEERAYGIWDPDTNATTEFFRASTVHTGYTGSEATYYIENGIVYEYTYATGNTGALFDTGLEGPYYRVNCFPDVIVVSEVLTKTEDLTLRFYDWNFQDLGSVHIDFPLDSRLPGVLCGETHERFMLTDNFSFIPRYYIEKSDLGTGNITIHEYEWDFEWE